jgi:L-fuconolactonase
MGTEAVPAVTGAVDSHHHFWRLEEAHHTWRGPEHAALERDFLPADLAAGMAAAGVASTVLVESADTAEENTRMLEHARATGFVAGIVAWLPVRDAGPGHAELSRLRGEPMVRGVRCLVGKDPLDWLDDPACRDLLAAVAECGLAWDVVPVTEQQRRAVRRAAEHLPDLRIVIDHMGRPPVGSPLDRSWAEQMAGLAAVPNVAVKVSVGIDVLTSWPGWDAGQLQDYVGHLAATFGPHRMMLASNWPVVELRRSYAPAWTDLDACLRTAGLDAEEMAAVRAGTARAWYRLPA